MKTELNLYKRLKGLLCVTLSMVMFFGMTLGVQAEGKRYVLTCNLSSDNKYSFTDKNGKPVANNAEIRANDTIELYTSGGAVAVCINGSEKKELVDPRQVMTTQCLHLQKNIPLQHHGMKKLRLIL